MIIAFTCYFHDMCSDFARLFCLLLDKKVSRGTEYNYTSFQMKEVKWAERTRKKKAARLKNRIARIQYRPAHIKKKKSQNAHLHSPS